MSNPLEIGETVDSSSPKVELGKSKAIFAAIAGVAVAVTPVLAVAVSDGAIDLNEGIALVLAFLGGAGIPGIGTYVVPTAVTRKQ